MPIAVSTVTSQQLAAATVSSASDIQRLVPSLQIAFSTVGSFDFTIRGSFAGFSSDPAVATYIDEVPIDARTLSYALFDLASVQQLKGPQGTLFGRNSTGGAVLFASNRPDVSKFSGYLDARQGNLDETRLEGALNVPLSSNLAVRIAGELERRGGTLKSLTAPGREYDNRHNENIRGSLLWKPGSVVTDYVQATHYRVREHRYPQIPVHLTGGCTGPTTPVTSCLYQPPFNTLVGTGNLAAAVAAELALPDGVTNNNDPTTDNYDRNSVTNMLDVDLDAVHIRNTSYYGVNKIGQSRDYDGTPISVIDAITTERTKSFYTETQVSGTLLSGKLDWRVGGLYSNDIGDHFQYLSIFSTPLAAAYPTRTSSRTNYRSTALFAQATYDFSNLVHDLSFTAGYRYTWDKRRIATFALQGAAQTCALQSGGILFPGTDSTCTRRLNAAFSDSNYNVTLQWKPVKNVLLYAATRKGYKTGSFNEVILNPALTEYQPEVVHDVEVGLKADWRIGNVPVRTNISVYRAKYNNIQSRETVLLANGAVLAITVNQDTVTGAPNKATTQGGEFEVTVAPTRWLNLMAYYSLVDAKYSQFFSVGPRIDLSGQAVPFIFRNSGGGTAQVDVPISGIAKTFSGTLTYSWHDKPTTNASISPDDIAQTGYSQIDARLGLKGIFRTNLDIALWGKNLSDNSFRPRNNVVGGEFTEQISEPRTYGIDARFHF
ncbi:hypothetical protein GCM10009087_50500 [Sphingomonas oligophenolica]